MHASTDATALLIRWYKPNKVASNQQAMPNSTVPFEATLRLHTQTAPSALRKRRWRHSSRTTKRILSWKMQARALKRELSRASQGRSWTRR
jgi:hypothetical protein